MFADFAKTTKFNIKFSSIQESLYPRKIKELDPQYIWYTF